VVLAPHAGDLHPDHVAAAALAERAYYLATVAKVGTGDLPPHRPAALLRYGGHREVDANLVVDVSPVWERRVALVRAYRSQLGEEEDGGPETNVSAPGFLRRLEMRAAAWGARIGAAYGEPYRVERPVPVDDVVATFRRRGGFVL
jgi:LmbE family N-acetylglucosaminyl deacetylase